MMNHFLKIYKKIYQNFWITFDYTSLRMEDQYFCFFFILGLQSAALKTFLVLFLGITPDYLQN